MPHGNRTCAECMRETDWSGLPGNPRMGAFGMCVPCYKRLIWRPANGAAVKRSRASQNAKRRVKVPA